MNTITTKYGVGDTVYAVEVNRDCKWVECPDCLGTMSWKAITPAGEEIAIECPACHHGYQNTGRIEQWDIYGSVKRLTVAQVQYNTHGEEAVRYMCIETGSPSGRVWRESDLHEGKEAAEKLCPILVADEKRKSQDAQAETYARKKKDRPGSMAAYYRKEIRDAKKKIKQAEAGLERQKGAV